MNLITIEEAVLRFKQLIEGAIVSGGEAGKHAVIRSSQPIQQIHDAVKSEFIKAGISSNIIYPALGFTKPELEIAGFIKKKSQDICILPQNIEPKEEELYSGLLQGQIDKYGSVYTEKIISINVRSQSSSLAKNFDTLYERTIMEAINLHIRCPKMCLGEVYMIAVPEISSKGVSENKIQFSKTKNVVEKYIKSFQAINQRISSIGQEYSYERVCLLIVDFSVDPPFIYHKTEQIIDAELLPHDTIYRIEDLNWESFAISLLDIYAQRFSFKN